MKHLTEDQKEKLKDAAYLFVINVASGFDMEVEDGEDFDRILQRELIDTFIEPLINNEPNNECIKIPCSVFVVLKVDWNDETEIEGVFTTEAKAEAFKEKQPNGNFRRYVCEYELK